MMNSLYRLFVFTLFTIFAVTEICGCGSSQEGEKKERVFIPGAAGFEEVTLQGFINNWDYINYPVSYALIRSPEDYDAVVSTVENGSPPEGIIYSSHEFLIVARVTPATETNWGEIFNVDSVSESGDTLAVNFHFQPAAQHATWLAKMYFCLMFPKKPYTKIVIIENGIQVGELHPADGQWSVPTR
jgi:hypothetical protein